jgi:hypothetical protein
MRILQSLYKLFKRKEDYKPIKTYSEVYRAFKRLHDLYLDLINTGYKNKVISTNEVSSLRDFIMKSSNKEILQMIKDLQLGILSLTIRSIGLCGVKYSGASPRINTPLANQRISYESAQL